MSNASPYKSQYEQDSWLNENVFKGQREGIFVEIGAYDGVIGSNTYFYEKELGWKGVCIEPIKERYDELVKNRNCICLNCCVYSKNENIYFQENNGYTEMLSGIINCYDPLHMIRINKEQRERGGESKILQKPAYTLTKILLENNINRVDYVSIDTEGSEFDIIKGIDFDKIKIRILDIENNYRDSPPYIEEFLKGKGYEKLRVLHGDDIYIDNKF
jgi:FkbM family methyltransferase